MAKKSEDAKEWSIARLGISLLLNNKTEEAEALFTGYPHSFHIKAGRCFVLFMVRELFMRKTVWHYYRNILTQLLENNTAILYNLFKYEKVGKYFEI